MPDLAGAPSDEVPAILATGRNHVTTLFVSMSTRHPQGRDAEYLEWHSLDHRPEQHRLPGLITSLRLVSTPACRAARAASSDRFDAVDHVMTYLFTDVAKLDGFAALSRGLRDAGRTPEVLPVVERGVFGLGGMVAAVRIKVGADVLPWWPTRGVYLIVEEGGALPEGIADVPGVGGALWATGMPAATPHSSADNEGLQVTYCLLDGDPVEVADTLGAYLEKRWTDTAASPLLAAPFYTVVNHQWGRYLP